MTTFKRLLTTALGVLCCALTVAGTARAGDPGSAAEAEAMVKKAVAYIKANGDQRACDEFTNGKSFKDRDLYVIVYDLNGKNLAHARTRSWWART